MHTPLPKPQPYENTIHTSLKGPSSNLESSGDVPSSELRQNVARYVSGVPGHQSHPRQRKSRHMLVFTLQRPARLRSDVHSPSHEPLFQHFFIIIAGLLIRVVTTQALAHSTCSVTMCCTSNMDGSLGAGAGHCVLLQWQTTDQFLQHITQPTLWRCQRNATHKS